MPESRELRPFFGVAVDRGRREPLARRAALVAVASGLAKEGLAAFGAGGEDQQKDGGSHYLR